MGIVERDYFRDGETRECYMPRCSRPVSGDDTFELCELHEAIWEADSDGCEAHAAAVELLPPMLWLTEVMGNRWLEKELKDLQIRAHDYSERRYLDYELLRLEDKMDLD